MPSRRQPGAVEPVEWKFVRAVGHVFPTENAEVEHFFRRELGRELRVEVPARGRRESVTVAFLHLIVDDDGLDLHGTTLISPCAVEAEDFPKQAVRCQPRPAQRDNGTLLKRSASTNRSG